MIRDGCVAPELAGHCTDDNPCTQCWIERDIEQHRNLYDALTADR